MMNRFAIAGGMLLVVVLAISVYRAKLGAEETQDRIDTLNAEAARIEKEIAVLKAEEAYLTRPERIGPIAQRLGLAPATPGQYTASEALRQRLGEERMVLPAEPEPAAPPAPAPTQPGSTPPR